MNHEEFMKRLCAATTNLCKELNGEESPCFCKENPIAERDIKSNSWRINPTIMDQIEEAFKNHIILNK